MGEAGADLAVAAVGEEAVEGRGSTSLPSPSDTLGTIMSIICASNFLFWRQIRGNKILQAI